MKEKRRTISLKHSTYKALGLAKAIMLGYNPDASISNDKVIHIALTNYIKQNKEDDTRERGETPADPAITKPDPDPERPDANPASDKPTRNAQE